MADRMKIEIVKGDISLQDTDAVVNAANDHLWMGSGVAGAIKRNGGREIEAEAVKKGPIEIGHAVSTGAGRLRAKYVIHAAVMGQDLITNREAIRDATVSSLRIAKELGMKSVSFPALGTGVGGFPLEEAAEVMIKTVSDNAASSGSGIKVRFVLFDDRALRIFQRVYERMISRKSLEKDLCHDDVI